MWLVAIMLDRYGTSASFQGVLLDSTEFSKNDNDPPVVLFKEAGFLPVSMQVILPTCFFDQN